jgi:hypothetical protein
VPVALHVDYWDDIGWADGYASPAHSARQQAYVHHEGLSQVYTPGLILQGHEWRGWFQRSDLVLPLATTAGPLSLEVTDGTHAEVRFAPVASGEMKLRYTVALLGFGVQSAVARGENAGKTLRHDFLVLAEHSAALQAVNGHYRADLTLPTTTTHAARYGLAVWVSRDADPAPLQAAGGWMGSR